MAALQSLKYLVVKPRAAHTSTVIFLHGLGDSGDGWEPVAETLAPKFPNTKWILPHAPSTPVTINGGMRMPSWFDIMSLDGFDEEDEPGILKASRSVNELITNEVDAGISSNKIVLGGFSQGCALALATGLTTERKLGGLLALSGWLPLRNKMKAMMSDHARNLPIFWGHGRRDQVVHYEFGVQSVNWLKDTLKIKAVTFNSYNMEHSSHPQEIQDLAVWLDNLLKKSPETPAPDGSAGSSSAL
ncbi:hypothetical protein FS837_007814 [Tulasnella sp. UAMH 9824]|nr:hypothetical protein FS837_007814 [Tulasnella sp. UAMH 9824]